MLSVGVTHGLTLALQEIKKVSAAIKKRNISAIRRAFQLWAGLDRVNVQYLQEAYWAWPCRCHAITFSILQFQDKCRIMASE